MKCRILHIIETAALGGAGRVLLNLICCVDHATYEQVVLLGSHGPLVNLLDAHRVKTQVVPVPPMAKVTFDLAGRTLWNPTAVARNFWQLATWARGLSIFARGYLPDLIHCHSLLANLSGIGVAYTVRSPLIWHEHNIQPAGIRKCIVAALGRRFPARIIAVSRAVASNYGSPLPSNMSIIPNGLDCRIFSSQRSSNELRKALGLDCGQPVVGIFAHLIPGKGHEVFLHAVAQVITEMPQVKFLVVGDEFFPRDAGYREYLATLSDNLSIKEHVIFTGFRGDVERLMMLTDVCVSASIVSESFPIILLEAGAAGKPVVASRVGGVPEIVDDGTTGLLIPPGNSNAMASALLRLLKNDDERRRMGRMAREKVCLEFTLDKWITKIEKVYREVLQK